MTRTSLHSFWGDTLLSGLVGLPSKRGRSTSTGTALLTAVKANDVTRTLLLLEGCPQLLLALDSRGNCVVHFAATHADATLLQLLLDAAGRHRTRLVTLANKAGFTPLHYAAYCGSAASAHALLAHGAVLTAVNWRHSDGLIRCNGGSAPLHIAVLKGSNSVAWTLLKFHAERMSTLSEAERQRLPDPRDAPNDFNITPWRLAKQVGSERLARMLNPALPLELLFTNEDLAKDRMFGPLSLHSIASSALQRHLLDCLCTIEAQLNEGGAGGGAASGVTATRPASRASSLASFVAAVSDAAGDAPALDASVRSGTSAASADTSIGRLRRAMLSAQPLWGAADDAGRAAAAGPDQRPGGHSLRRASVASSGGSVTSSSAAAAALQQPQRELSYLAFMVREVSPLAVLLGHDPVIIPPPTPEEAVRLCLDSESLPLADDDVASVRSGIGAGAASASASTPPRAPAAVAAASAPRAIEGGAPRSRLYGAAAAATSPGSLDSFHLATSVTPSSWTLEADLEAELSPPRAGTGAVGGWPLPSGARERATARAALEGGVHGGRAFLPAASPSPPAFAAAAPLLAPSLAPSVGECGVCLQEVCSVALRPCRHELCLACCRSLCTFHQYRPAACPFCRGLVSGFQRTAQPALPAAGS